MEAANTFLQDRLLHASGYPVLPVGGLLRHFRGLPFSAEVVRRLLCENVARLLKL
ncbi:MAG TPA: amidohydrolase family protein [Methylomirabilota bacterium]|nr:amidohydrolase family protein [Methylomirabilota bacterium]